MLVPLALRRAEPRHVSIAPRHIHTPRHCYISVSLLSASPSRLCARAESFCRLTRRGASSATMYTGSRRFGGGSFTRLLLAAARCVYTYADWANAAREMCVSVCGIMHIYRYSYARAGGAIGKVTRERESRALRGACEALSLLLSLSPVSVQLYTRIFRNNKN